MDHTQTDTRTPTPTPTPTRTSTPTAARAATPQTLTEPPSGRPVDRRTLLASLGVSAVVGSVTLTACGTTSGPSGAAPQSAPTSPSAAGSASASGPVTVAKSDVPSGGGVVVDQRYVVTQPEAGTYKAFTSICTHKGCVVNKVTGGQIVCPCHGSHYSITDGSVVSGPAPAPLAAKTITAKGSDLVVSE